MLDLTWPLIDWTAITMPNLYVTKVYRERGGKSLWITDLNVFCAAKISIVDFV
jgi:hypothetical protein